jgi:uridylate kinase
LADPDHEPAPLRVLLKLSGEALMGASPFGVEDGALALVHRELAGAVAGGAQIAVVIGGGNIFRGLSRAATGMDRVRADQMGMLATVMNAIALQEYLDRHGLPTRVQSAMPVGNIVEPFNHRMAVAHLQSGFVVVFAGGTGNPFFTTDTAASLRAIEIGASLLVKATKVDGVYDADPVTNPGARRYEVLSYDECLAKRLGVMDATAIALCRDNELPIRVCSIHEAGNLKRIMRGEQVGTLVNREGEL